MSRLILFNKPFNVLSQFSNGSGQFSAPSKTGTLAEFISEKGVYPAGRLDKDSEGLLLLTDDGRLQHRISDPRHKLPKTYWVQVEGELTPQALQQLCHGVKLKDGLTRPAEASVMAAPDIWERTPPVRFRKTIPTSWLSLTIREGRNRQVRRMTAAVGFPTLRLVRVSVGKWTLRDLQPGEYKILLGARC